MPRAVSQYKQRIDAFVRKYLQDKQPAFRAVNLWGSDVITRLDRFVARGKTIRGSLVLLSHDMFGGANTNGALRAAGALELIHAGLLIHDDIMDQDQLRRGQDAMHVQYERATFPRAAVNGEGQRNHVKETLSNEKRKRCGEAMAMCVGDVTFFMAMELLSSNPQIHQLIASELSSVCLAQMQDVSSCCSAVIPSSSDVMTLYRYKTARYSFSLPLTIGAILAQALSKDIHILDELGESFGILFQIRDDQLNASGKSEETGKPVGSDAREGKKTFARIEKNISRHITRLTLKSESLIDSLSADESYKKNLRDLLHFINTRNV